MRIRCTGAMAVLAAVLTVLGCGGGPKTGEVSGTVTIDGQKAPTGSSITFLPADGKGPSAGAMIDDGRYTATVPVGNSKVEIRAPKFTAEKTQGGPGGGGERVIGDLLPAKYHDKSELTFDVQSGRNEKNWDLKTK